MSEPASVLSRRDRKKEATRREIYEAAMRLFAAASFGDVTITEICEAADVGRGTFFLHFPTKASLLYEFNERVTERFRESLAASERRSARDELCALVDHMGIELSAQAEIMAAMLSDFFTSPETLAQAPNHGGSLAELITQIIERGQRDGDFEASLDARLCAASFLSTATVFISGKVVNGLALSDAEIRRQFLHLTFHGLGFHGLGASV